MSGGVADRIYSFGDFLLDARRRVLLSHSTREVIALPAAAVETLLFLVERAGDLVAKDALLRTVWQDLNVEENSLARCISTLRRALGENPSEPRFIATVPGRGYRFIARVASAASSRGEPSLAVLPFKPLGDSDRDDALPLGMTEALIRRIGRLSDVGVKPLSSVRRYGGLEQDAVVAGRELGADIVVDGSVQRHGDRLHVAARLFEVVSGRQIWSGQFDEHLTNIFLIQDAIAERAASALVDELTAAERRELRRHSTDDVLAYQAYVTGWSALTRPGSQALETALRALKEAVARDPGFALAHTRLAHCYMLLGVFGLQAPDQAFPQAQAAARRALERDPESAEAQAHSAHINGLSGDVDGAERGLRRALDLNPRLAVAHHWMGIWSLHRGRIEEALAAVRRAQALEPLAPIFSANIGMIYYYARRYAEAIAQLTATLDMDPGFDHARSLLGRTYLRIGDAERAIEEFQRRGGTTYGSAADIAAALALAGRRDEALAGLRCLLDASQVRYVSGYDVATVYAALGDTAASLDWLERAMEITFVDLDPALDAIRTDARFRPIVERFPTRMRSLFDRERPNSGGRPPAAPE
jgi:DNA-binding winged helix-turn-helix (wHTH) protein/tetratricopeptide (TPR) repeat protein